MQVSLVSIVDVGSKSAHFGCPHHCAPAPRSPFSAKLESVAGYVQNFWTCWIYSPSLAEVFFFFFFLHRDLEESLVPPAPSPLPVGLGEAEGLRVSPVQLQLRTLHPRKARSAAGCCTPLHHATFSSCITMAMVKLVTVIFSHHSPVTAKKGSRA